MRRPSAAAELAHQLRGAPRAAGQLWGQRRSFPGWVVRQASNTPRWIDEWWYERKNIPALAIASVLEFGAYAVVLTLTPLPFFAAMGASVFFCYLNEFHTMALAIRHRDLTRFNQPQTWERNNDGKIVRMTGFAEREAQIRAERKQMAATQRYRERFHAYTYQYWHKSKRLPSFVFAVLSTVSSFVLPLAFGISGIPTAVAVYGLMGLASLPDIRNGWTAWRTGSVDPFNESMVLYGDKDTSVDERQPLGSPQNDALTTPAVIERRGRRASRTPDRTAASQRRRPPSRELG